MRVLNRPMFRYGGPIKEGIMDGMKDNKQAINTVGSPLAPKDETGRGGYAIPLLGAGLAAAARFLPAAYRGFKAARAYTPMSQNLGAGKRFLDIFTPKGGLKITGGQAGEGAGFRVGSFLRQNPITSLSLAPQVASGIYSVGKSAVEAAPGLAKGYVDMLIPGESIFKDKPPSVGGATELPGGTPRDRGMGIEGKTGMKGPEVEKDMSIDQDKLNQMNKDRIQATKDRYYRLMGIDKMDKEAVYDSLIDASKIISEEGADLKGALKSGTLQSKIIGAISGQLDKSKALKRQIDAAVLKGEIEKDINKEKNQLDAEYKKLAIEKLKEEIGPGGLRQDILSIYGKQGVVPMGEQLAALARNRGINITSVSDTTEVSKWKEANKGKDEVDFLKTAVSGGTPDGTYVINNRILVVKNGKVIPYL